MRGQDSGTGTGVQLTAVAGARSSAAAEVAGIHDCWLVWGWRLELEGE